MHLAFFTFHINYINHTKCSHSTVNNNSDVETVSLIKTNIIYIYRHVFSIEIYIITLFMSPVIKLIVH